MKFTQEQIQDAYDDVASRPGQVDKRYLTPEDCRIICDFIDQYAHFTLEDLDRLHDAKKITDKIYWTIRMSGVLD